MTTHQAFLEHLGKALYHLYEPDRLGQNPLAALFGVANRPDAFAALQRILTEAIQTLEPPADEPPASPAWQVFEPLFYRFVQQLDQEQVARQLGMSVRHLRRKEHAAVEVLAARLWQQYHLEGEAQVEPQGDPAASPSVAQELAWLREAPPERPVDLSTLLPDTIALARPLAQRHQARLELATHGELPAVPVHEIALSQLLLNLFGMAIPCAKGGLISVSTRLLPEAVEIYIQVEQTTETNPVPEPVEEPCHSSADVALDVARQLAHLCGGRLALDDSPDGFCATLVLPGMGQIGVLVVDDNADTLQLVRRFAVGTRYQVVTTQDPLEVVALAERVRPEIIVLDVMMPRVDGWRLLAQLRERPWADQTALVVCTILPQQEMALALGADGFLQKPITRVTFLNTLDRQMEQMGPESR